MDWQKGLDVLAHTAHAMEYGVFAEDSQGRILVFNRALSRITGHKDTDALQKERHQLLHVKQDTWLECSLDDEFKLSGTHLTDKRGGQIPVVLGTVGFASQSGTVGLLVPLKNQTVLPYLSGGLAQMSYAEIFTELTEGFLDNTRNLLAVLGNMANHEMAVSNDRVTALEKLLTRSLQAIDEFAAMHQELYAIRCKLMKFDRLQLLSTS